MNLYIGQVGSFSQYLSYPRGDPLVNGPDRFAQRPTERAEDQELGLLGVLDSGFARIFLEEPLFEVDPNVETIRSRF